MEFSFIHAADLHIGSPFRGLASINEQLRNQLLQAGNIAFDRLISTAIENEVDFVLICGDSFDSASGSLAAQFRFAGGMRKLQEKNISVFIITGNHDPLSDWSENLKLPDNVTVFGSDQPQRTGFNKNGVEVAAIYGVSFGKREENRNLAILFSRERNDPFTIAMLHGTTGTASGHHPYCPFSLEDLRKSGMDYWALGHIHKREIIHPASPLVIYPGNIQGRHFNEEGAKGCYLIRVNNEKIDEPEFIQLGQVVWLRENIDLSETENITAFNSLMENRIHKLQKKYPGNSLVISPVFTGSTPLYGALAKEGELEELILEINRQYTYAEHFVFFNRIRNHTRPAIDLEERKKATDFFGELLREVESLKSRPGELEEVLNSFDDELAAAISRRLESEKDNQTIIEAAEQLLITSFLEKSEGQ